MQLAYNLDLVSKRNGLVLHVAITIKSDVDCLRREVVVRTGCIFEQKYPVGLLVYHCSLDLDVNVKFGVDR